MPRHNVLLCLLIAVSILSMASANPSIFTAVISCVPSVPCDGTNNDDTMNGSNQDDKMDGLGGNDKMNGNAGADYMVGGDYGNDTINGGDGDDTLLGFSGQIRCVEG